MALISKEFSGGCFDFDHLSASCLGGLVFNLSKKRPFLVHILVDLPQHQDGFSKDQLDKFSQLQPFQGVGTYCMDQGR